MDRDRLIDAVQRRIVPSEYAAMWEQAGLVEAVDSSFKFRYDALSQLTSRELQQLFAETKGGA